MQVAHPIHDQSFYLDEEHKKKLKEEFGEGYFLIAIFSVSFLNECSESGSVQKMDPVVGLPTLILFLCLGMKRLNPKQSLDSAFPYAASINFKCL